jgi:hypothetical protein
MRHQIAHGDGLAEFPGNLEIEIIVHVAVEIDLARLHKLHHGRPGKRFRDGARPEHRLIGNDGAALGNVGITVTPSKQDLPVLDDDEYSARDVSTRHGIGNKAVGERFDILRGERMGLLGQHRKRAYGDRHVCVHGQRSRRNRARHIRIGIRNSECESDQRSGQHGKSLHHFFLP